MMRIINAFIRGRNQFIWFIGLVFVCIPSFADTDLVLSIDQDHYTLGPYVEYLEDPHGQWSYADVSSPPFSELFKDNQDTVFNAGFTDSVYWLKIKLSYPAQDDLDKKTWLLELVPLRINTYTPYTVNGLPA